MKKQLTLAEAQSQLTYDPSSGTFTRVTRPSYNASAGGISKALGYLLISVCGKQYYGHRLAWFYSTGRWPVGQIDHVNGDRADNRLCNLRDVSIQVNRQNQRKPHARKKSSALLGVTFVPRKNKWVAQIQVNGHRSSLGYFATQEQAYAAYVTAKRQLHAGNTL